MKQLIVIATIGFICTSSIMLYSSKLSLYQAVDIYVCDSDIVLAEMTAKTSLSRKELLTVSYCTCESIDASMKSEVKRTECKPPKDIVYSCTCIGKTKY